MHPRLASHRFRRLIEHFPVVVVAGARQVGKTTLIRSLLAKPWTILTMDPTLDVAGARRDPDLLLANHRGPLAIDEVQYAPELVAAIKRSVDADRRPGRFVLTGSQQWSVLRSLAESLAGRSAFLDLSGFTLQERAGAGDRASWLAEWLKNPAGPTALGFGRTGGLPGVNEFLYRGSLPEASALPLDLLPDFFAGYRRTYIERDVRLLGEVGDAQLFGRFLGLAAALSGQEVNASQLGRELGLSPPTARRWLGLLQGSYQWFEVPAFSRNAVKRTSGRVVGYFADTGLLCASLLLASPAALDIWPGRGAIFETAVVADLRAQAELISPRPNFWRWRLHSGTEVDLVLEWNGQLYPIEVKLHSHPGRDAARGIARFREAHPRESIAPGLVIAPTERAAALTSDTWLLPWDALPRTTGP
jgi:predicted AAA+ superfamily ATPase